MRRHNLLLLIIVPLLLLLTLTQFVEAQGPQPRAASSVVAQPIEQVDATPDPTDTTDTVVNEETDPDEAVLDAGEALSQPLGIRIRQTVPITVLLDLFGALGMDVPITGTATLTASVSLTALDAITATQLVTSVIPLTLPAGLGATEEVTDSDALTTAAPITTVETLPLEIPDADVTPEADDATGAAAGETVPGEIVPGEIVPGEIVPGEIVPDQSLTEDVVTDSEQGALDDVGAADATTLGSSFPLTVELDISFLVTDTMTSTVPAVLVLRFAGLPTMTVPISIEVAQLDTALVTVTPLTSTEAISTFFGITTTAVLTDSDALTSTGDLTDTSDITTTDDITISSVVTVTGTLTPTPAPVVPVTVTVPVTANVRSDADLNGEIARTVPPQTVLTIVAVSEGGDWLLLDDGNWLATVVLGQAPANLAPATAELVEQLREAAALAPPTATPTPAPPEETPTPSVVPTGPVTGTTTTNANLRAGPGTEFDLTGATVFGQLITITARNEAGDWLQLDTGSWIAAGLVANTPPVESIPVFDPNVTPEPEPAPAEPITDTVPAAEATPEATAPSVEPSDEGTIVLPTATPRPPTLGVDGNIYLIEFDTINANYERALTAIDRLIDSAAGNAGIFSDVTWTTDMNTAVALLRNASSSVARLTVPEAFTAAHNSLTTAAMQYTTAADLLAAGMEQSDAAQFDAAFSAITLGDASLAQAAAALASFRP